MVRELRSMGGKCDRYKGRGEDGAWKNPNHPVRGGTAAKGQRKTDPRYVKTPTALLGNQGRSVSR